MAATVMGRYIRDMASDTAQDHFPGRPIRPLPKRRLRERLSPEAADAIVYPPSSPAMSPVFFYPYNSAPEDEKAQRQHPTDRARQEEIEHNYISRRNTKEADSDEDYTELAYRSRYNRRHSPYPSKLSPGTSYRYAQKQEAAHEKPAGPASITSSADGYDSFENTNNKKKRKIPTPGDAISNGILLQNDLASLGISSPPPEIVEEDDIEESRLGEDLYDSVAIKDRDGDLVGTGRGRLARTGGGRSPLRSLAGASSNAARSSLPKQSPSSEAPSAGIISTAISNAENYTKQHINSPGPKGNGSLLDAVASQKPNPTSAQFTFTCDSQVPGSVAWPPRQLPTARNMGQALSKPAPEEGDRRRPHPGRRTSSSSVITGPPPRRGSSASRQAPKDNGKAAAAPKKRRPTGREYLIAARERKERQQLQNYHHPPSPEDQWICEFCEYERIFGEPPKALIRQYEIKDRALRKQEAERRRLLEKAKMKGRKSKRNVKPSPNDNKVKHAASCGSQGHHHRGARHDHNRKEDGREEPSDTYSVDGDPGDPEEEFIDDEQLPPLRQTMAAKLPPPEKYSRPKPGTVQGGAGSSEKFVS